MQKPKEPLSERVKDSNSLVNRPNRSRGLGTSVDVTRGIRGKFKTNNDILYMRFGR
jgi:hypothetical protein